MCVCGEEGRGVDRTRLLLLLFFFIRTKWMRNMWCAWNTYSIHNNAQPATTDLAKLNFFYSLSLLWIFFSFRQTLSTYTLALAYVVKILSSKKPLDRYAVSNVHFQIEIIHCVYIKTAAATAASIEQIVRWLLRLHIQNGSSSKYDNDEDECRATNDGEHRLNG